MTGSIALLSALSETPQSFLQPDSALHSHTLTALKGLLDPLAADVAAAQKLRRDENRKKRKRSDVESEFEPLQLRQVYTDGLGVKQIWEQARRVLDAACTEIEAAIVAQKAQEPETHSHHDAVDGHETDDHEVSEEVESGDELQIDDTQEDGLSEEEDLDEVDISEEDLEESDAGDSDSDLESEQHAATYVQDPHKLNDGFFSIDDFNKQTQFLEQQDARGEDDNPSDEDEIDWDADPSTMTFHKPKGRPSDQAKANDGHGGDQEDSDEEGPTFGDADLDADESDEDMIDADGGDLEDGLSSLNNANDLRYADFFAPPPKQQSKTKRMRALPKTQPAPQPSGPDAEESETDLQRAISDVRRDLLESEEEDSDLEADSDMEDAGPSMQNMSTHEKQRAAIAAEIRRLEAANVAKRDWTLIGEARGVDRPLNSLIEEDMEFERVGKPVPVVTAEVSEEIEQLIKRRILAREFDEVIRRRPDAIGTANEVRRGRIELDDSKPQSGLAEVYEQEHLRSTDPEYVDKRSAATKKQHEEISRLWKEVSSQLDLLSNLHFKPKRVEAEIKSVADKPTISMEDARPVGLGVNAEESMLAPQEVFRPGAEKGRGEGAEKGVVVRASGASSHRDEMTREEKLRRRRREKERQKKAASTSASTSASTGTVGRGPKKTKSQTREEAKADILAELRKGNVKVVGKEGELQDLAGKKARPGDDRGAMGGGALKM